MSEASVHSLSLLPGQPLVQLRNKDRIWNLKVCVKHFTLFLLEKPFLPQSPDVSCQRVLPGGQAVESVLHQLLLVHPAVGRALCLRPVLLRGHGHHVHLDARLPEDGAGEIIPGCDALIGGEIGRASCRERVC